jgi:hypothetical protein
MKYYYKPYKPYKPYKYNDGKHLKDKSYGRYSDADPQG